jgi:apolipoprotein D and lipocalin family protein
MNTARPNTSRAAKTRSALTVLGLLAAAALAGCSSTPTAPLPTVAQVDLARYAGGWYEITALPNPFQSMCVADTKARYKAKGDDIEVFNRCRRADGTVADATGIAKVTPDSGNARLRVSFFRPFYGDYWVLALPDDYRWVLVGEPGRRYAWLLARTPQLSAADVETALQRAAELGFDRSAFKLTPQTRPLAD